MARCIGSVVVLQGAIGCPGPPRLMFATAMSFDGSASVRVAVTQSMPQMIWDQVPPPCAPSTLTENSRVPGATPITPAPSLRAPIVPATWVPWPWSS
jgi:hypothetical protein